MQEKRGPKSTAHTATQFNGRLHFRNQGLLFNNKNITFFRQE